MTKNQAVAVFNRDIRRGIPNNDKAALREAWNEYTDNLYKQGLISLRQVESWMQPNF